MSDPKRYKIRPIFLDYSQVLGLGKETIDSFGEDLAAYQHPEGKYVRWEDYAHLKAEYERLRASSFVTAVPVEEYEKLKAEVERLRKAGDAMAYALNLDDDVFDNRDKKEALAAWNAAKDGKPTA